MDGAVAALLGATSADDVAPENLESYYSVISTAESEIPGLLNYIQGSLLVSQKGDVGKAQADAITSQAIGLSAANSTEIVGEIQGISEAMEENNKVTEQLNISTKRFENL